MDLSAVTTNSRCLKAVSSLCLLLMLLASGCAWRTSQPLAVCVPTTECDSLALAELATVSLGEVPAIEYSQLDSLTGKPLEIAETESVRLLGWRELVTLVRRADGKSKLLANISVPQPQDRCLVDRNDDPECLRGVLALQAEREAQAAVAQAGEAYLGLQECYLQNELLLAAKSGSERRRRIFDKLRANGLSLDSDPRELERQELNLDKQFARLAEEYQAATIALELLLHLPHQPTVPLWPTDTVLPFPIPGELPDCLSLAFQKRSDRQALLALKSCLGVVPPDRLSPLLMNFSPGTNLLLPPQPARWIGQRRTTWEREARTQLHQQLCELMNENEKQITLEVNLAFARRWAASEQLRVSSAMVSSLQASLDDIEALRAIEAVNIQRFLELEQRLAGAQSDQVAAILEQAKADLELALALGILTTNH